MVFRFFECEDGQRRGAREIRREGWFFSSRYFSFQPELKIQ